MLSFSTVTASLALIASVSGLPTSATNTDKLEARAYRECTPGTWYSKCGAYDGCFDYDPCKEIGAPPPPPAGCNTTPPPPPPPAVCTPGRIIGPPLIDLQVKSPDAPATTTSGNLMGIYRDDSKAHRFQDQVALFSIPKGAKTCTFGYQQSGSPNRTFVSYDNGARISTIVIPSLPSPITYNAAQALLPANAPEVSLDFTNWDLTLKEWTHTSGNITCSENIYIYLTIAKEIKQGGVLMQGVSKEQGTPEEQQGLFIDYTC